MHWICQKVFLLLLLPLLALDCAANVLIGGSFSRTLSAEAWAHRHHKYWSWCWKAIDAVFGTWHCLDQHLHELRHGGVWRAWWADFRGE